MVIAEQNLRSELYPYQERVLLFVDPELVSASVCSALLLEIQAAQEQQSPEACMRHVVAHALQAALGEACHVGAVHRKLQASSRRVLEHYFHAVVAAVEQVACGEGSHGPAGHLERLQEIYRSLLGPAAASRARCAGDPLQDGPPGSPLPSPTITFHLWTGQEQLWKELARLLRSPSQLRLSADLEALDLQGLGPDPDLARVSVLSTDSGIERDLPWGTEKIPAPGSPEVERAALQRKGGIKKRLWPPDFSWDGSPGLHRRTARPGGDGELLPGVARVRTARVLVLGDDRMLGRLAQAYCRLRKQESQKFCLTPRLSLQLYYIPVLSSKEPAASRQQELGELATFLGQADPWYQSTVNTLCPAIHKLAEMPPCLDTSQAVDPFILDAITYYVRMGTQPIYFQIYRVKIFSDLSQEPTEDVFLTELKVKIHDTRPSKEGTSPRRRGAVDSLGAELSLSYRKVLLSHRPREVTISLRATGLILKAIPASDTEVLVFPHCPPPVAASAMDHRCLNVSVSEVVKSCHLAGKSFSMVTNTFRTSSIQVQSQDQRPLMLCLDKDNQRMFRDVVRFEVDPCPEPCLRTQKSKMPWLNPEEQKTMEQTQTMPNPLQMPINTFSGIIQ
ncbi:LOW QUALITY PROTEIN: phosphoinositide 3-kinase regulatory subunit 6 [Thomomys bottae]